MFADKAFTWTCKGNESNSNREVWVPPRCRGGKHQHVPSRPVLTTRRDCLNKVNCLDEPTPDKMKSEKEKSQVEISLEDLFNTKYTSTVDVDSKAILGGGV